MDARIRSAIAFLPSLVLHATFALIGKVAVD